MRRRLTGVCVAGAILLMTAGSCGRGTEKKGLAAMSLEEVARQIQVLTTDLMDGKTPRFTSDQIGDELQRRWPEERTDFVAVLDSTSDPGVVSFIVRTLLEEGDSIHLKDLAMPAFAKSKDQIDFGKAGFSQLVSTLRDYIAVIAESSTDDELVSLIETLAKSQPGYRRHLNEIVKNLATARRDVILRQLSNIS